MLPHSTVTNFQKISLLRIDPVAFWKVKDSNCYRYVFCLKTTIFIMSECGIGDISTVLIYHCRYLAFRIGSAWIRIHYALRLRTQMRLCYSFKFSFVNNIDIVLI